MDHIWRTSMISESVITRRDRRIRHRHGVIVVVITTAVAAAARRADTRGGGHSTTLTNGFSVYYNCNWNDDVMVDQEGILLHGFDLGRLGLGINYKDKIMENGALYIR